MTLTYSGDDQKQAADFLEAMGLPSGREDEQLQAEHSKMVTALCKSGEQIRAELTADDAILMHHAIGISGEAGELLDAVKKTLIYRKPLDRKNVIEELGDLEFYMEGLRQCLNLTREQCLQTNIDKLAVRYKGMQYTDAAAHARADKAE